jgi:hypothetical protein
LIRNNYRSGQPVDDMLPKIILSMKKSMELNNDDSLVMISGLTGVGKSTLEQHIMTIYCEKPDPADICITRKSFAQRQLVATKRGLNKEKDVVLAYDEAGVTGKNHGQSFIKDIQDLYMINRAAGILHLWCWPNFKGITRSFIDERIRGVFFCFTKSANRPRKYVFYTKDGIMSMLDKGIELTTHNLKTNRHKYGYYIGCFTKYAGVLTEGYAQNKKESIIQMSQDFASKHGGVAIDSTPIKPLKDEYGCEALRRYIMENFGETYTVGTVKRAIERLGYISKVPNTHLSSVINELRNKQSSGLAFGAMPFNNRAVEKIIAKPKETEL